VAPGIDNRISVNPALLAELSEVVGREHISVEPEVRYIYGRDIWPRNTILMQRHKPFPEPEIVLWPGSTEEVRAIVALADKHGIPLIPLGAASGVCGGTVALEGGITIDLKRMDRILNIDHASQLVTAEAGIIGEIFERRLNHEGYTLGHFPSSMYCSSLGGWLATRSAGQLSTRYGKIEDMDVSLEAVLPDGRVLRTKDTPRSATGPDWKHVLMGSEGCLGIITQACLRVWPYPSSRRFLAFKFPQVKNGLSSIQEILQQEIKPAAVRLYDPVDTLFSSSGTLDEKKSKSEKHGGIPNALSGISRMIAPYIFHPGPVNRFLLKRAHSCKLVLTFEGDPEITAIEQDLARQICRAQAGQDMGEGPARHWWEKRYKVSYFMSQAFDMGFFVDTIEVATVWSNLERLYRGMLAAIAPHAFVMAHFSHAYPQGCSIYYSVAATGKDENDLVARYDRIWEAAMEACVKYGGTITHHHGVGLLKARWLAAEQGGTNPMLLGLKKVMDPNNIMNPGKLGLKGNI
jgi:alkyldihydroxyacetonephosphate synthase